MLLAGGRSVYGKTVTEVLKCGLGQHFQVRGHDPKPVNNVFFLFFFRTVNLLTGGFVYATLSLNRLTRRLQTRENY